MKFILIHGCDPNGKPVPYITNLTDVDKPFVCGVALGLINL
jgi:hypothetical protein